MPKKSHQRLDILATVSGVMIALQARANGELSHRLGNGVEAALISFGSGLIIIALIALFSPAIKTPRYPLVTLPLLLPALPMWARSAFAMKLLANSVMPLMAILNTPFSVFL